MTNEKELKLLAKYIDRLEESLTKINGRLDIIEENIKINHEFHKKRVSMSNDHSTKITDKIWEKIGYMDERLTKNFQDIERELNSFIRFYNAKAEKAQKILIPKE